MAIPPPWALHVDGSNCFNRLTPVGLTGAVPADNTSLTVTALDGQVVTPTGNFTNATVIGTYSINGECAVSGRGLVTGIDVPYIANQLNGNVGDIAQSAAPALRVALTSPELSPSTRPAIQA